MSVCPSVAVRMNAEISDIRNAEISETMSGAILGLGMQIPRFAAAQVCFSNVTACRFLGFLRRASLFQQGATHSNHKPPKAVAPIKPP